MAIPSEEVESALIVSESRLTLLLGYIAFGATVITVLSLLYWFGIDPVTASARADPV